MDLRPTARALVPVVLAMALLAACAPAREAGAPYIARRLTGPDGVRSSPQ